MNILEPVHHSFKAKVSSFIVNGEWRIPPYIESRHPILVSKIKAMITQKQPLEDFLIWHQSLDCTLSARQAYNHIFSHQPASWANSL
jgi:hypothetical protein